jgi:hypothetical protein
MILEIELGALVALELLALVKRAPVATPAAKPAPAAAPSASSASSAAVEIVKLCGARWVHVGHRAAGHPDIVEALATPGLALVHADGTRVEGIQ